MSNLQNKICIVVLQRGNVLIGKIERDGSDCTLHSAQVIRRWGTTHGLGELAEKGQTSTTVLDKCYGTVFFDYLTVIFAIECKRDIWEKIL